MRFVFSTIAVLCVINLPLFATTFKPYAWEENRARYTLSERDIALSEIIIKQHMQFDYLFEDNDFVMYSTVHRIVFVNNGEAVQKHNRIVVSMANAVELVELRARAISVDGKVVYFDKNNLKELKDEASGKAFKIFAIEGVEMGSEIEYYFIRKMRPSLFDRVYVQFDVPIKHNSFMLTSPEHLKFDFKTYNDFPNVRLEDDNDMNVYLTSMEEVPPLRTESFSNFEPNRKRIEFKLAYNTAQSDNRLYTWNEAGRTFSRILLESTKDEQKAVEKLVKNLKDDPTKDLASRIAKIESLIKNDIKVNRESGDPSLNLLAHILKVKLASDQGMTRLFLAVFERLGIACHPVMTCSRERVRFDGEFDTWAYLDEFVLYFPDTKQFMSPYVFEVRYPFVQPDLTAQKGLFIRPYKIGETRSAISSIGEIPAIEYRHNLDNMSVDVSFNEALDASQIRHKREFGGYNAIYFTPYYDMMSGEQRQGMIEELTKQIAPDAAISEWKAYPVADSESNNFVVDVAFKSSHFLEKAGPRLLFKIGELIGPQIEMYRDEKRSVEVENDFNRMYDRTIRVKIPAGYQIKNPEALVFDIVYQEKDQMPFVFKSSYTIQGEFLEVRIEESYKQIHAPIARYEDFRKVVNAAADFNKITLVLEKRK